MRCDDVFEILTSGPFPSGAASDDAVERHLLACHECRKFAEALRPLEETPDAAGMPAYQGRLLPVDNTDKPIDLVSRVQTLVLKEHESRLAQKRDRSLARQNVWRFIVACAAVFLLGAAAAFASPLFINPPLGTSGASTLHAALPQPRTVAAASCSNLLLAKLTEHAVVPVNLQTSKDACCVKCHGGAEPVAQKNQKTIGMVVLSCQKCHDGRTDWVRL